MKKNVNPIEINEQFSLKIEKIIETEHVKNTSLSKLTLSVTNLLTDINNIMEETDYLSNLSSDSKEHLYDAYDFLLKALRYSMVFVIDGKNMYIKNAKKDDYIPDENYMKGELSYYLDNANHQFKFIKILEKNK